MTDAVRWYRCATCGAIQHAADLGTPWAGVGWQRVPIRPRVVYHNHGMGKDVEVAEPLSELPREVVLS